MKRVTSIGGVFFKTKDKAKMTDWYNKHLGLELHPEWGMSIEWRKSSKPEEKGFTALSLFSQNSDHMGYGDQESMINFRVADLEGLLKVFKEEGVKIVKEMQVFDYGKFAHIEDPEGRRIELWEPNDEVYESLGEAFKT